MKTQAMLRVTPELFVTFLMAFREGEAARALRVVEHALPTDTRFVRVDVDDLDLLFLLESDHFIIAPDAHMHAFACSCTPPVPYLDSPKMKVEYFA